MDFPKVYWAEYGQRIIDALDLKQLSKGEWHGPCPACGGTDRFWISNHQGEVKVHCRQCGDYAAIQKALIDQGLWPVNEPSRGDNVLEFREREVSLQDFNGETYDIRKRIELHGAKLEGTTVVVPITNVGGKLVGYQRISPDGQKRFSSGMDKEAAFGVCGKIKQNKAYIAEGYATSSSVYMATGVPCVFALDSGNLPKVCAEFAKAFPDVALTVAADNDEAGIKAAKSTGLKFAAPKQAGADWNDILVSQGRIAVATGLKLAKRQAALFTHLDDLQITKPNWLIDGLIEQDTLAMCFGAAGSGKTFCVMDMALCISSGKDYHGHAVEQGTVFYIAGEGHSGFARRAAAWKQANGIKPGEASFFKSNKAVIMSEPESVEVLKAEMAELVEKAGRPRLVVIDTLARSLGGADENAGKDINLFIVACDEIKEEYGCTVLIVHHPGHQNKERGRGASQINAALDHEFRIEAWDETKIILTFTKQKEDAMPEPKAFLMVPVEIITDDMESISSIVLEYTPDLPGGSGERITAAQSAIIKLFRELCEHGELERDRLRDQYIDRMGTGNRDSDRSKFNKHMGALLEKAILQQKEGVISEKEGSPDGE